MTFIGVQQTTWRIASCVKRRHRSLKNVTQEPLTLITRRFKRRGDDVTHCAFDDVTARSMTSLHRLRKDGAGGGHVDNQIDYEEDAVEQRR